MTEWFYSKMGLQQGPVPEEELRAKIRRGEIGDANLIWKEGMTEWIPLSRMPELMNPVARGASSGMAPPVVSLEKPSPSFPERQIGGNVPLPQPPAHDGNFVGPEIPNYMWQSIVAAIVGLPFLCLLAAPFGIVAIVFASKVDGLRAQGDIIGATVASNNAKNWMIASFVCSGLLVGLIVLSLSAG